MNHSCKSGRRRLPFAPLATALALSLSAGCSAPTTAFDLEHCRKPAQIEMRAAVDKRGGIGVATVNMWGIPFVSQHIDERFDALAARLNADPAVDVVGLQEVWARGARNRLLAALRDEFPHQADFHGDHGRSGLAIVSRRPFTEEPHFHPFSATGKWWKIWNGEWLGGKGAGAVRVELDDGKGIWVVNTHLHACYAEGAPLACDDGDEFEDHRNSQLLELRDFAILLARDEPAIVLGDFNFTPTSRAFAELQRTRPDRLFDPGWEPLPEAQAPPKRIDHIWLRPGRNDAWRKLAPARVVYDEPVVLADAAAVPLSDHCAVAAIVKPEKTR